MNKDYEKESKYGAPSRRGRRAAHAHGHSISSSSRTPRNTIPSKKIWNSDTIQMEDLQLQTDGNWQDTLRDGPDDDMNKLFGDPTPRNDSNSPSRTTLRAPEDGKSVRRRNSMDSHFTDTDMGGRIHMSEVENSVSAREDYFNSRMSNISRWHGGTGSDAPAIFSFKSTESPMSPLPAGTKLDFNESKGDIIGLQHENDQLKHLNQKQSQTIQLMETASLKLEREYNDLVKQKEKQRKRLEFEERKSSKYKADFVKEKNKLVQLQGINRKLKEAARQNHNEKKMRERMLEIKRENEALRERYDDLGKNFDEMKAKMDDLVAQKKLSRRNSRNQLHRRNSKQRPSIILSETPKPHKDRSATPDGVASPISVWTRSDNLGEILTAEEKVEKMKYMLQELREENEDLKKSLLSKKSKVEQKPSPINAEDTRGRSDAVGEKIEDVIEDKNDEKDTLKAIEVENRLKAEMKEMKKGHINEIKDLKKENIRLKTEMEKLSIAHAESESTSKKSVGLLAAELQKHKEIESQKKADLIQALSDENSRLRHSLGTIKVELRNVRASVRMTAAPLSEGSDTIGDTGEDVKVPFIASSTTKLAESESISTASKRPKSRGICSSIFIYYISVFAVCDGDQSNQQSGRNKKAARTNTASRDKRAST
eukprot:CAMPEP_0167760326 /NCGR_PEP_ID=MMETSP0110_2-20121227/11527_1 /TAXON_ID=629695 /ORGANISM="Gymnochlora sp., Strain CCMP2014" /LENGTH=652 /DNA_ID=CAMNT_0007646831 /DNA_START=42 /DNA_END=1996 /DNA_ORIENTATION=+